MAKKNIMQFPTGMTNLVREAQGLAPETKPKATVQESIPREDDPAAGEEEEVVVARRRGGRKPTVTIAKPTVERGDSEWDIYLKYLEYYRTDPTQGRECRINDDLRYELDRIRITSRSHMPLKAMVNAILNAFVEFHKDEIENIVNQRFTN